MSLVATRTGARAVIFAVLAVLCSCSRPNSVGVRLQIEPFPELERGRLNVRAEVKPASNEYTYRWFSKAGECIPQHSEYPKTIFVFGEGHTQDRLTVEVWRGSVHVARAELGVSNSGFGARENAKQKPQVKIEMTDVPPFDPLGGPATRAHIGGKLTGDLDAAFVVVLYARLNKTWFVQPSVEGARTLLRSDHSFSNWTHTGVEYAIVVARSSFTPPVTTDILPLNEEEVIAYLIVPGERAEAPVAP
jgi:hypothetical protein